MCGRLVAEVVLKWQEQGTQNREEPRLLTVYCTTACCIKSGAAGLQCVHTGVSRKERWCHHSYHWKFLLKIQAKPIGHTDLPNFTCAAKSHFDMETIGINRRMRLYNVSFVKVSVTLQNKALWRSHLYFTATNLYVMLSTAFDQSEQCTWLLSAASGAGRS